MQIYSTTESLLGINFVPIYPKKAWSLNSKLIIMNRTDPVSCQLDIINKFYTKPHLRWFFIPLAVLNCVVDGLLPITSVGGSSLLLVAVIKFPELREVPSNLLLASLAVSDLLIGLMVQPFLTARQISLLLGDCLLSANNFLKFFASYSVHGLLFSSCLNICLITMDRYICIAYSLRYQDIVTKERVVLVISVSWVFSLAFATIQGLPFLPGTTILKTSARVFATIPPVLLVFILILCYFKVTKIARQHQRQIRAQMNVSNYTTQQDFQSTKTALLTVGVIFLCYAPAVIVVFGLYVSEDLASLEAVKPFLATLACLNSSVNPLVYYLRSRKIRRYAWKVVKCGMNWLP